MSSLEVLIVNVEQLADLHIVAAPSASSASATMRRARRTSALLRCDASCSSRHSRKSRAPTPADQSPATAAALQPSQPSAMIASPLIASTSRGSRASISSRVARKNHPHRDTRSWRATVAPPREASTNGSCERRCSVQAFRADRCDFERFVVIVEAACPGTAPLRKIKALGWSLSGGVAAPGAVVVAASKSLPGTLSPPRSVRKHPLQRHPRYPRRSLPSVALIASAPLSTSKPAASMRSADAAASTSLPSSTLSRSGAAASASSDTTRPPSPSSPPSASASSSSGFQRVRR